MTKKVVAIVFNSVIHDIRVIKEAESLQKNGYDVSIVGIKDNKNSFDSKRLLSGVNVKLVAWKYKMHQQAAKFALLLLMAGIVGFAALGYLASILLHSLVELVVNGFFNAEFWWTLVSVLLVIIFPIYPSVRLYKLSAGQKQFFKNYFELETGGKQENNDFIGWVYKRFDKIKEQQVYDLVVSEKPDIIHIHDIAPIPIAAKIKQKLGCKVVYDAHEIYEELSQGATSLKAAHEKTQRLAEQIADKFITVNQSIADYYENKYPNMPKPTVIKNACLPYDLGEYDGRLHKAANLPLSQNILLYQGGFARRRGLDHLLNVVRYLPNNWSLVMMGWGAFEPQLKSISKKIASEMSATQFEDEVSETVSLMTSKLKAELLEHAENFLNEKEKLDELEGGEESSDNGLETREPSSSAEEPSGVKNSRFTHPLDVDGALAEINIYAQDIRKVYNHVAKRSSIQRIVFLPPAPQSQLRKWTQGATIGVIPYENVGLNHFFCSPNKIWEYPAAGVPFIASPFPELSAAINDNGIGWLAQEPFDPQATADLIKSLSEEEIAEKVENCKRFSAEDNWLKYEKLLTELYQSL